MRINLVGKAGADYPKEVWLRSFPDQKSSSYELMITNSPVISDWTVFRSLESAIVWRSQVAGRTALIVSEPPEIQRYPLSLTRQFDLVLGPRFRYISGRANYRLLECSFPSRLGFLEEQIDFGDSAQLPTNQETELHSRISVVTSNKKRTRGQRRRLRLLRYLSRSGLNLERYGRGFRPVADKATVLNQTVFHLALENSVHPFYWTEKLIDALISRNVVFYLGTDELPSALDRRSIVTLPKRFPEAKKIIENTMQRYFSEDERPGFEAAIRTNQNLVSNQLTFGNSLLTILRTEERH